MKYLIVLFIIFFQCNLFSQSNEEYSEEEIANYFRLAKKLSDLDNGKLWGKKLYGPIMLVNPDTRKIYTNYPDKNAKLKSVSEDLFIGKLDNDELFANTATTWNGVYWTQLMLSSLNKSELDKGALLMHECWHRIQDSTGFSGASSNNNHLDELNGRIYLQLEWKALLKALKEKERKLFHIENALIFRNYRRSLFEGSAANENKFEMHEGLAEYTGFTLSTMPIDTIIVRLEKRIGWVTPTRKYSNSFAYIHGIAYGSLLEGLNKQWNKNISPDSDFGDELRKAIGIKPLVISNDLVRGRMKHYNGHLIVETEKKHEVKIQQKKVFYRKTFITGKTLTLPCATIGISFNPNNIINLDNYGKVYEVITVKSNWGVLKATNGALVWKNWKKVIVSKPNKTSKTKLVGDGWEIELKKGWEITNFPDKKGSFVLTKKLGE